MDYNFSDKGANTVISLSGKMSFSDHGSIREIVKELTNNKPSSVVVDLSSLSNIDSSGIGMLMLLEETGKDVGYSFSLRGVQGQIESAFNVCKLSEVITIT